MITLPTVTPGKTHPLGATYDGEGVNFAIYSQHATKVTLCLFSDQGQRERHRLELIRHDHIWCGYVNGIRPGQPYGYRIDGPYDPGNGHRFNVNKLLIDPYARQISGPLIANELQLGHISGAREDLSGYDVRDSVTVMPRSLVVAPQEAPSGPIRAIGATLETSLPELLARIPDLTVPATFPALADPRTIAQLKSESIGTLVLTDLLAVAGIRAPVNFFTPEPELLGQNGLDSIRDALSTLKHAGIATHIQIPLKPAILSTVAPTLCLSGTDNHSYYGTDPAMQLAQTQVRQMIRDSLRYWTGSMGFSGANLTLDCTGDASQHLHDLQSDIKADPALRDLPVTYRTTS